MSLALSLFLGTFVLEDLALASALAFIAQGKISFSEAFLACALGIAVGDVGLYFLGRFAARIPFFLKKIQSAQFRYFLQALKKDQRMDYAVVISRAVPGTRLPTYLAAGVIHYSFMRFLLLTVLSVSVWVYAALSFGQVFFSFFRENWIAAFILFFVFLSLVKKGVLVFEDRWSFRAALHSWRKWLHFEFWPAWFFYIPIVPFYVFLSIRYRSLLNPFYAGPQLKHGGLIGESKWDFLKYLDPKSDTTLRTFFLPSGTARPDFGLEYPFIVKPDVGQRGFGVRIVKGEAELLAYLELSEGDVIVQQRSQFAAEAGIFYVRLPDADSGYIFSITDKKFPVVVGDGKLRIGDLILADKRARIMASTYFERHRDRLDQILPLGKKLQLSEGGNHCQGAIFENGQDLSTKDLLNSIERIVSRIPDFYFGRIDVRYKDAADLKKGLNFEIIEVNGAGSEATHIWDANTKLIEAYRVLFRQWNLLFLIGAEIKKQRRGKRPELFSFVIDCIKVWTRSGPLTTSS